jgi:peptidoglycan/xylan/chitin deacetylase (PgdA/CDA1 family)
MKIPIIMYHEVNEKDTLPELSKYIYKKYIIENNCFEAQLDFLSFYNYNTLTICELDRAKEINKKNVVITFDDGYAGSYLYAFHSLKKVNFKATFFITTDWIGLPNMLNWEQVKEMSDCGMEIGSHSASHQLLGNKNGEMICRELSSSKSIIESKIKKPVTSVSYPNGSYNPIVNKIAQSLGYTMACTSDFGYWDALKNDFIIPRFTAPTDLKRLKKIIDYDYSYTLKEFALDKAKKTFKFALGRKLYDSLYLKFFNLEVIKKK